MLGEDEDESDNVVIAYNCMSKGGNQAAVRREAGGVRREAGGGKGLGRGVNEWMNENKRRIAKICILRYHTENSEFFPFPTLHFHLYILLVL